MSVRIRKRKGAWWIFINFHGQRKAKKIGTREAAERVKRELEAKLSLGDFGVFREQKQTTPAFGEYAERCVRQHAANCKPATTVIYRRLLRLYILPTFAAVPLDQITRAAVKDFLAQLVAGQKLKQRTIRLAVAVMRRILNAAIEEGIISVNPAAKVGKIETNEEKFEAVALTSEESDRLLEAAKGISAEVYALLLIALRAGLRKGEILALKWGDINFGADDCDPNRFLYVRRNYSAGQLGTPKTGRNRRVDMSKDLRTALLEMRDQRMLEAMMCGRPSVAADLIFRSCGGTLLDPNNMRKAYFLPALERAGIRQIRFHDLRHTFGSQFLQRGASLLYVSRQMGHSSIKITADTYAHLIEGADIAFVDSLATSPPKTATQAQPEKTPTVPTFAEISGIELLANIPQSLNRVTHN